MVATSPPADLAVEPSDIVPFRGALWRLYNASGPHSQRWNSLRYAGPLADSRFDPHLPPSDDASARESDRGVMYASADSLTPFAEIYQHERVIQPDRRGVSLVNWRPTRELRFLDLRADWLYRNGASNSVVHGDRAFTREWARSIYAALADRIDGVTHRGAMLGRDTFALFTRTVTDLSFPDAPLFHARLTDPSAAVFIQDAIERLNLRSA